LHNNEEVEIAVCEWLLMQEPDFYHKGILNLMPRWEKCIDVLGYHVEK
jgi:hypothetical protein